MSPPCGLTQTALQFQTFKRCDIVHWIV